MTLQGIGTSKMTTGGDDSKLAIMCHATVNEALLRKLYDDKGGSDKLHLDSVHWKYGALNSDEEDLSSPVSQQLGGGGFTDEDSE